MKSSAGGSFKRTNKNKDPGLENPSTYTDEQVPKKQDPEYDIILKIIFVGDSGTDAKIRFIHSYVKDTFSGRNIPRIGTDFYTKIADVRGKKVKLGMWDTAGQDRYMSLAPMYYRGAAGIVVGYDIARRKSLETLRRWYVYLKGEYPDAVIMVVGNKVDLEGGRWDREVSYEEGDELANELGASLFFETSAKTEVNVNESMSALVEEILMTNGILNEMGGWVFMSQ